MNKKERVLIIGGAGFIGSHTADELDARGYTIRILDNLNPKTHSDNKWPSYLKPHYEKFLGDERNSDILYKALIDVDYVIDLAAEMDLLPQFSVFFDNNLTSTALLYELIVKHKLKIKKVVVASSQFVYGEGRWECYKHGIVYPKPREVSLMSKKIWDPVCPFCGNNISSRSNLEIHQDPPNQYAISKYAQELVALKIGRLFNIPSAAMRYSIVHGPRQSLKNAYSGALRVFSLQLLSGKSLSVYEDGLQLRDYVSVYDVAKANATVMESPEANFENFNVGGGVAYTVLELAEIVSKSLKIPADINLKHEFRVGDIRHAVSDITKLKQLKWKPEWDEVRVVKDYLSWIKKQPDMTEYLNQAQKQLKSMGVVRS